MKFIFRADASLTIGSGHVMRCLTLSRALSERGMSSIFICRPLVGDLITYLQVHGVTVLVLPGAASTLAPRPEALLTDWQQDADSCLQLLDGRTADWLIADHYGLDARWQKRMRSACRRILVIDDLANRHIDADALLDTNPGRNTPDYDKYLSVYTRRYIGPNYALLRQEFSTLRAGSLARRSASTGMHILISLGGADIQNVTETILLALANSHLPRATRFTVVLGLSATWRTNVEHAVVDIPYPTQLFDHTDHMAELMSNADLAIGAAGTTALERCCMGLPSIQLVLADNQATTALALVQAGAALTIPLQVDMSEAIQHAITLVLQAGKLTDMQQAAAQLVDGQGCARVIKEVLHVE